MATINARKVAAVRNTRVGTSVPGTAGELQARIAALGTEYLPYLRSLPPPLGVQAQEDLTGTWRWRFEVEDFTGGPRPVAPDWFRSDYDDRGWDQTTVPEWRYDRSAPFGTRPAPGERRPDSRIAWYRTDFARALPTADRRVFLAFAGVAWEAEVWLNGTFLGRHLAYWEPFRFDVTSVLRQKNLLAVRVLSGPKLGEPTSGWTMLSCALAAEPRYVRDAARSVMGQREIFGFKSSCFGTGFGIHGAVFLETTGAVAVAEVFVRGHLTAAAATVRVETDASQDLEVALDVQVLPENFEGEAFRATAARRVAKGGDTQTITVPMPGARAWQPTAPCLYRCRVTLRDTDGRTLDVRDALFGCRSFRLVTAAEAAPDRPAGMFLLNEQPVFLRGTDVSPALNTFWYGRQTDKLLDTILLMKAANFNAIRACEHIHLPAVRELLDRLGMLSEQDMVGFGDGCVPTADGGAGNASVSVSVMAHLCVRLARACYNNPGVVLLTTGGIETHFDPLEIVRAVLAADPERVIKPISGNMRDWPSAYECPPPDYPSLAPEHWNNVVNDFHCYNGWYRRGYPFWQLSQRYAPGRLLTVGEFGAEGLDAYATMQRYPARLQPPLPTADALWGHAQVKRGDPRLAIGGRGREPEYLADYIAASQRYQADVLAEQVTGFRLSPRRIGGYFVFHFIDGLPAEWQKSIVSFDLTPKHGYFEMAQANQPVVPLFQVEDAGKTLALWVANDRCDARPGSCVSWCVTGGDETVLLQGRAAVDVRPLDATPVTKLDISALLAEHPVMVVALALTDAAAAPVSHYRREVYLPAWAPPEFPIEPPASVCVPRLASLVPAGDPAAVDWTRAACLTGWRRVEGQPTRHVIEARIIHDGSCLYLRLVESGLAGALQSDDAIWTGEDWELFFAARRAVPYRQYGINPRGASLQVVGGAALPPCPERVVSRVDAGSWTVLLALPLATLVPGGLRSGSVFYGNFYRQTGCGDVYRDVLAWSPNYRPNCHEPGRFGELILE